MSQVKSSRQLIITIIILNDGQTIDPLSQGQHWLGGDGGWSNRRIAYSQWPPTPSTPTVGWYRALRLVSPLDKVRVRSRASVGPTNEADEFEDVVPRRAKYVCPESCCLSESGRS